MSEPLTPFSDGTDFGMSWDAAAEQMALIQCIYWRRKDKVEEILLGCDGAKLLLWFDPDAEGNEDVADVPGFCLIQQGDAYFIAIEGTRKRFSQWRKDFTGAFVTERTYREGRGFVHGFFAWCADQVYDRVTPLMPGWQTGEINVSGHSLGGATANLLSLRLKDEGSGNRVRCITYGEPRSLRSGFDVPELDGKWRVVNGNDIVEKVPLGLDTRGMGGAVWLAGSLIGFANWKHYGLRRRILSDGTFDEKSTDTPAQATETPRSDNLRMAHYPSSYVQSLTNVQRNYGKSNHSQTVLAMGASVGLSDEEEDGPPLTNPSRFLDFQALNAAIGATGDNGFTADNWQSMTVSNIEPTTATVGPDDSQADNSSGNKGFISMSTIAGVTDTWRCVAYLNNAQYGKRHTICVQGPTDEAGAREAFRYWVAKRAALLGCGFTTMANNNLMGDPDMSSPVYQYMSIYDAKNPRVGAPHILPYSVGGGFLQVAQGNTPADHFANALSLRMTGVCSGPPAQVSYHNECFVGFPDKALERGRIIWGVKVSPTIKFQDAMQAYINAICGDRYNFGFMGQDGSIEKKLITAFAADGSGQLRATLTGHGYVSGDQVNLTETGNSRLHKKYRVGLIDADTFVLLKSKIGNDSLPKSGRVQLTKTKAGVPQVKFFKFTYPTAKDVDGKWLVKISKANLSPKTIPVSFAQKGSKRKSGSR